MTSNVVPLAGRRYPPEMVEDLKSSVDNGEVQSLVVITRDKWGKVNVDWSSMKNDELAFAAVFLNKVALDNIE